MKKILFFILIIIISINGLAQFPITQSMGSATTKLKVNGGLEAVRGLINGVFTDTTAANADQIEFYNGAQIWTRSDRNFWLRDSVLNMWIKMAKFSDIAANVPTLQQVTTAGNTSTNDIIAPAFSFSTSKFVLSAPGGNFGQLSLANVGDFAHNIKPQAASIGGVFYLPNTGNATDTLATLADVRAGGGGGGSPTIAGLSVLGTTGTTSGAGVDITAANNEDVLMRNGDVLQFAQPNLIKRDGNQVGFLLNKTSLADTVGLKGGEVGGATYTISGSKLVVAVSGDYSWVRWDSLTSLDVIQGDWIVSFNSFGAAREAQFGIHDNSFPSTGKYSIYGTLSTRNDNGTLGRMYIVSRDATGASTILATSTSDLGMSTTDSIQVKFYKFENVVTFSARNMTTNSAWVSVTYTLTGTQTSHSVGSVGIVTGTNDYNIHQFKISSKQVKNPDVYLFGDSKFTKSTYQNESLAALLKNNYSKVYANCAVGSTSADLVANRWEVINNIQPDKVLIVSSNDIRLGVSSGTWQANLTTLYNDFTAAGIGVYFTVLYETNTDQSAMDTWLLANYPSNYIRSPWLELQKYGSGILLGDGIHLSAIGNKIVADALTLDGRLETVTGTGGFTQLEDFTNEDAWTIGYIDGSGNYTPLPLGSAGKVLTTNGASSAPTWETPSGGGTINTGSSFKAAYYPSTGTTIDDVTGVEYNHTNTLSKFIARATNDTIIDIRPAASQTADIIQVTANGGTIGALFSIKANGFVGIGSPAPQTKLQVGNDAGQTSSFGTAAQILFTNSGSGTYITGLGPSGSEFFAGAESGRSVMGAFSNHPFDIRTNNTTRLTITAAGETQILGSFSPKYNATATGITLDVSYGTVEVTATGQTITLPTAVGITGRVYTIKLTASGSGTVATTSSQTIDGSTTYSLASQYKYVTVQSNGANWIVIANN